MYSLTIIAHHEQIAPQPIDELVYDYKELLDLLYNYIILSIYIHMFGLSNYVVGWFCERTLWRTKLAKTPSFYRHVQTNQQPSPHGET
jgi:hypothetical protein